MYVRYRRLVSFRFWFGLNAPAAKLVLVASVEGVYAAIPAVITLSKWVRFLPNKGFDSAFWGSFVYMSNTQNSFRLESICHLHYYLLQQ